MPDLISMHQASIMLALPEFLIRDFTSYGFNGRKLTLQKDGDLERREVLDFQRFLEQPWPGEGRMAPPDPIQRRIYSMKQVRNVLFADYLNRIMNLLI